MYNIKDINKCMNIRKRKQREKAVESKNFAAFLCSYK